jgi:hypothetical protein
VKVLGVKGASVVVRGDTMSSGEYFQTLPKTVVPSKHLESPSDTVSRFPDDIDPQQHRCEDLYHRVFPCLSMFQV